jgi:hypothetical protein
MNAVRALALVALFAASPAFGHGNTKPQHGGIVQMSGETLFELVNKPNEVAVYVVDDDEPVAASKMTGKLTVTSGGKSQSYELKPAAGNKFEATGLTIAPGSEVAVQVVSTETKARLGATFQVK